MMGVNPHNPARFVKETLLAALSVAVIAFAAYATLNGLQGAAAANLFALAFFFVGCSSLFKATEHYTGNYA